MRLLILVLFASFVLFATDPVYVLVLSKGQVRWIETGASLVIVNGKLEAAVPAMPKAYTEVLLTYDSDRGGWPLPSKPTTKVRLWVNGVRYFEALDYSVAVDATINKPVLRALPAADGLGPNLLPTLSLRIDYEE